MKEIGTKLYERNWTQKKMKEIGIRRILKKLEPKEYKIL
jgi:hypothetical protein